MAEHLRPDVIVYVCSNCVPDGGRLHRQWKHDGAHVLVREVPCSGKTDTQYLLCALEGGAQGLCVVACPKGECQLAQGNYRAQVRIGTIQRLLAEIGLEPQRAEMVYIAPHQTLDRFQGLVGDAVRRICALPENPLLVEMQQPESQEQGSETSTAAPPTNEAASASERSMTPTGPYLHGECPY